MYKWQDESRECNSILRQMINSLARWKRYNNVYHIIYSVSKVLKIAILLSKSPQRAGCGRVCVCACVPSHVTHTHKLRQTSTPPQNVPIYVSNVSDFVRTTHTWAHGHTSARVSGRASVCACYDTWPIHFAINGLKSPRHSSVRSRFSYAEPIKNPSINNLDFCEYVYSNTPHESVGMRCGGCVPLRFMYWLGTMRYSRERQKREWRWGEENHIK